MKNQFLLHRSGLGLGSGCKRRENTTPAAFAVEDAYDEGDPVSHGINVLPKYVPSTTLKDPTWQNTHVIEGDVEAAVRELKAKTGRELQVHGSGGRLRWLLERDLVDELNLRLCPVVVGDGLRHFPERGPTHAGGSRGRDSPHATVHSGKGAD